jgi:hypothetical protein
MLRNSRRKHAHTREDSTVIPAMMIQSRCGHVLRISITATVFVQAVSIVQMMNIGHQFVSVVSMSGGRLFRSYKRMKSRIRTVECYIATNLDNSIQKIIIRFFCEKYNL